MELVGWLVGWLVRFHPPPPIGILPYVKYSAPLKMDIALLVIFGVGSTFSLRYESR
jgi:hypothetical protein